MTSRVVLIQAGKFGDMKALSNDLRERGCDTIFYPSTAEFDAARDALTDADVLVASGSFPATRKVLETAPHLRALVSPAIGTDKFDEAGASALGVIVANGQAPEHTAGMAESTILLILACLHDLPGDMVTLRNDTRAGKSSGRLLAGKTVGIIGLGNTGRAVAMRLGAWGVRVIAAAPRLKKPAPDGVEVLPLEDVLRLSDVVTIHANLHAETHHLLNAKRLALMKPDATLINTARGAIIDEAALIAHAQSNPAFRLGLDVFEVEPLAASSPLRSLPNAILTPHTIGQTREAAAALPKLAVENVMRALAGQVPVCVRNPDIVPQWLKRWGSSPTA